MNKKPETHAGMTEDRARSILFVLGFTAESVKVLMTEAKRAGNAESAGIITRRIVVTRIWEDDTWEVAVYQAG